MKKRFLKIVIGIVLVCILFVGFLYANNNIGMTSTNLETDIRSSQKIKDDWTGRAWPVPSATMLSWLIQSASSPGPGF